MLIKYFTPQGKMEEFDTWSFEGKPLLNLVDILVEKGVLTPEEVLKVYGVSFDYISD